MVKIFSVILAIFSIFGVSGCRNEMLEEPKSSTVQQVNQGTSYSNERIAWGFKKNKNAAPDIPAEWAELLSKYDGYYIGTNAEKVLYLTFDEGYENGYTADILDTLKEQKVPATFFVTGPYIDTEPELVKRMTDEGHIVGNHTVNHPSMPDVSDSELKDELAKLNEKYFALTGKNMSYLRPPKGEFSERTLALSQKAGYKTILWSSAYADWDVSSQKGAEYAINQVGEQFHNGSIILLHAVSKDNAEGLLQIIKNARNQGYVFKSLDEL